MYAFDFVKPVSIADAQLRTASSNIGLIVVGPSIFGSGFE